MSVSNTSVSTIPKRNVDTIIFVTITTLLLLLIVMVSFNQTIGNNLSGQQAMAFLRGEVSIPVDSPASQQDLAIYNSNGYSPFPPAPAVLLMPFIAIGGPHVPILALSLPLTLASILLLLKILGKITESASIRLWLVVGFIFGTAFLPALQVSGYVWHLAHVVAVFFVLLAIYVAFCVQRNALLKGALTGAALAVAFLSRQMCIVLAPFVIVLLWQNTQGERRKKILLITAFLAALGVGGLIYLWFNWVRFGNPLESGYRYIKLTSFLDARFKEYGLFSTHYIPFNLSYFVFQGFHINYGGINKLVSEGTDPFGAALLAASPFLIAAFYARANRLLLLTGWTVIAIIVVSDLFYYNNGYSQLTGPRFALDYLPVWIMLVAYGTKNFPSSLLKGFIIWAVVLNYYAFIAQILTKL